MSIFSIIQNNLIKIKETHKDILAFSNEDIQDGCAFMIYALETIFRHFEIGDIENGITDSAYKCEQHDYGIDAVYLTGDGENIVSLDDMPSFNEDSKFVFHILQFKKGSSIDQADLLKLKEGVDRAFIKNSIEVEHNEHMFHWMKNLNEIKDFLYAKFQSKNIKIVVYVVFAGVKSNIEKNSILNKQLEDIKILLTDNAYQNNEIEIIDAQKLIDMEKVAGEIDDIIQYNKTFKYITETDESKKLNGYICIVSGHEIANLVKNWQSQLFEANIRDYYKKNDINSKIIETSANDLESKYFWSYNNGLTITCKKVEELPNDRYKLYGMQIVNGCQTSNAIYTAFNNRIRYEVLKSKIDNGVHLTSREMQDFEKIKNLQLSSKTTILIKIIETNDNDLIYRITETTNSQTPIKKFSLKANENIHQNIERYLKEYGIFYERRINYYKNKGERNVISIQKLFQLYFSCILYKPSQAKSKTKQLFEADYERVFPSDNRKKGNDFLLYLIPILIDNAIGKKIREYQITKRPIDPYSYTLLSHARLHLGPFVIHSIIGSYATPALIKKYSIIENCLKNNSEFDNKFTTALENLKRIVQTLTGSKREMIANVVKKNDLDEKIVRFIRAGSTLPKR